MIDDLLHPDVRLLAVFDLILLILGSGCALAIGLFVLSYSAFYRWRKNAAGRSVMYLLVSLFSMFVLGVLSRGLGSDYAGRSLLTLTVFVLVLIATWHLLFTLWDHYYAADSERRANWPSNRSPAPTTSRNESVMTALPEVTTAIPVIWHKGKRVVRTVFQGLVGGIPVLITLLGVLSLSWDAEWIVGALASSIAIQGVLAKLMANETINAWLIRNTPLGSEPKPSPEAISYP